MCREGLSGERSELRAQPRQTQERFVSRRRRHRCRVRRCLHHEQGQGRADYRDAGSS